MGGEFYAYVRTSAGTNSAIVYVGASDSDAVLLAYNVHCPAVAKTAYKQSYLSLAQVGTVIVNGVVSTLASSGDANQITGRANKDKV